MLWATLQSSLPEHDIVYNNREIEGREFDCCVLLEGKGILIIEVKGWQAERIKVEGVDRILVEGYEEPQRSPKKQARAYRFALLNSIKRRFNASPLVLDMVCYPFISKREYFETRLDIVTEEAVTLFKEDLDDSEAIRKKIEDLFATSAIAHSAFTRDLQHSVRLMWEPSLKDRQTDETKTYSILSVHPKAISVERIKAIADSYFSGVKHIVFLSDNHDYDALIGEVNRRFKDMNVQPGHSSLSMGWKTGLSYSPHSASTFNFQAFLLDRIEEICPNEIVITNGELPAGALDILDALSARTTFNSEQYLVEHAPTKTNTLVQAGAGTGKTFSMVSRIAFLCNAPRNPIADLGDELAMVTFTNDAATNMKSRLKQMFQSYFILCKDPRYLRLVADVDRSRISTIHSFAIDLLRDEPLLTGMATDFTIASDEYGRRKHYDDLLESFIGELVEDDPDFWQSLPVNIYELRKKLIQLSDTLRQKSVDLKRLKPSCMGESVPNALPFMNDLISRVLVPAEDLHAADMRSSNRLELAECMSLLINVMVSDSKAFGKLKIRYLFIDEFQDTDNVQIELFKMIQARAAEDCRLFVVGDLKQSIYRFRGATLAAFDNIREDPRDWSIFSLTTNYRSDHGLLVALDEVFQRMGSQGYLLYGEKDQLSSTVNAPALQGPRLSQVPCHGKDREGFFNTLFKIVQENKQFAQECVAASKEASAAETVAILVRSNWQVDQVIREAKKRGITVETNSSGDLFHLDSTLDLYRLVAALLDSTNPAKLTNLIASNYSDLDIDFRRYRMRPCRDQITDLTRILNEFMEMRVGKTWSEIVAEAASEPTLAVLRKLYTALQPWKIHSDDPRAQRHYTANYEYLTEIMVGWAGKESPGLGRIADYLRVNISTNYDTPARDPLLNGNGPRILCTTVHKSKGLEYGTVIIPFAYDKLERRGSAPVIADFENGLLSYLVGFGNGVQEFNSNYDAIKETKNQVEEEFRILYVALTRAIRNCIWMKDLDERPGINWASMLEG